MSTPRPTRAARPPLLPRLGLYAALPALLLGCSGRKHPGDDSVVTDTTGDSQDSGTEVAPCDPTTELVNELVPDGNTPILVFDVTVDAARNRAWSTSLMTPTLAEVDTETASLVKVHNLGDFKPNHGQVQVDGEGNPWFVSSDPPGLEKLDATSGTVTVMAPDLDSGTSVLGRPGGGAWVSGLEGVTNVVLRVDADGTVSGRRELDYPALTLTASATGGVAALVAITGRDQEVWVLDGEADLATLDVCPVALAGKFMTQLTSGDFIVTYDGTIATAPCGSATPESIWIGTDNKEVFPEGDGFIVLDRQGDDSALGPNWGIARHFDRNLNEIGASFATGKNTGYGGVDSNGLIWANSEDTTEVWALDPATGAIPHKVLVGLNVETVLPDPLRPSTAIITGRLSSTVGRLDTCTGIFTKATDVLTWPISPVIHDDVLYVIDQLTSRIQKFDAVTLAWIDTLDADLGDNYLLTFDYLIWHPDRGTLFLSQTQVNQLYEMDPSTGAVLQTWPLNGELVTNKTEIGRVQLVLAGGYIVAVRPRDGQVTVIDPDESVPVAQFVVDHEDMRDIDPDRLDLVWATADGSRFYIGPHAYDGDTFVRVPEEDVDATAIFAESADGQRYGWSFDDQRVARFALDGGVTWEAPANISEQGDPSFRLAPAWGDRLFYATFEHATVRVIPSGE